MDYYLLKKVWGPCFVILFLPLLYKGFFTMNYDTSFLNKKVVRIIPINYIDLFNVIFLYWFNYLCISERTHKPKTIDCTYFCWTYFWIYSFLYSEFSSVHFKHFWMCSSLFLRYHSLLDSFLSTLVFFCLRTFFLFGLYHSLFRCLILPKLIWYLLRISETR